MASVGEKRVRLAQKKAEKLKDASAYWKYLEQEGNKCLRDI
jgi:hypothetical protein